MKLSRTPKAAAGNFFGPIPDRSFRKAAVIYRLIILCLILGFGHMAQAQTTVRISGCVYDAVDGHPLHHALITLRGTDFAAVSDQFGRFELENIPDGRYRPEVSAFGYISQTTEAIDVVVDITRRITVHLEPRYHDMGRTEVIGEAAPSLTGDIEIIDQQAIQSSNAHTLAEVLDRLEGVYIQDSGPAGGKKQISIRGSAAKHVLVLLDGRRLNPAGSGEADLNSIPLEMIEKVEVYKGGESARFGADALGGVVNIITQAGPGRSRPELKAHTYRGRWDTDLYDLTLIDPVRFKGLTTKVTYGFRGSEGDFDYNYTGAVFPRQGVERVYAGTRANADFESRNYFISSLYQARPGTSLNFSGQLYRSDQGLPGKASQPDSTSRKTDDRILAGIGMEHQFSPKQVLHMSLGYSRLKQEFENEAGRSSYHSRYTNDIADMEISGRSRFWSGNEIGGGVALRRDILYHDEILHPERSMGRTIRDNIGLFASDRQTFDLNSLPVWDLAAVDVSLRRDRTDTRQDKLASAESPSTNHLSHWSQKIGASLSAGVRLRLVVRGSYGTSYRLPEMNALFWKNDIRSQGNPDLKPERSEHSDAGFEISLDKPIRISAGLTYFHSHVNEIIIWRPSSPLGIWTPENLDAALITGHEDFVQIGLWDDRVRLSYGNTITNPRNKSRGSSNYNKVLTFRPHYVTSLDCDLRFWILRGAYQIRMADIRYLLDANTRWYGAYRVDNADFGIQTEMSRVKIEAGYRVRNLRGENYELIAQYPMPGREWGVDLSVSWRLE